MEAFVELGGKQVRVSEGMEFSVFKLKDKKAGDKVEMNPVCFMDDKEIIVDRKKLKDVKVVCEVLEEKKGKKVYSFKKKPKTGYKKGHGHRDALTVLKVSGITRK
jgi:large subunit ribosomal protein L21